MGVPGRLFSSAALTSLILACGGPPPEPGSLRHPERVSPALACTQGPMVPGIDVSHLQGTIDWSQVKADGFQFAYAKATEGITYSDPDFKTNWAAMKAAGVTRGAYHFFHPDDAGKAQADAYLAQVGAFSPGDLPPMLDWEVDDCSNSSSDSCPSDDASLSGCYAVSAQVQSALDFIAEIEAKTGLKTTVYTYPYFWSCLNSPSALSAYPLYQATYPSEATTTGPLPPAGICPAVLAPWSSWTLWQWAETGSVSGIQDNPTDLDVFNGTLADLQAFTIQGAGSGGGSGGGSAGGSGGGSAGGSGGGSAGGSGGGSAGGSGGGSAGGSAGSGGVSCPAGSSDVGGTCVVDPDPSGCDSASGGNGLLAMCFGFGAFLSARRRKLHARR